MKEYKFRAWDKEDKEMFRVISISWIEGKLDNVIVCGRGGCMKNPILMQFTGLSDKNGVEIFEGDICKCEDLRKNKRNFEMVFRDGQFLFKDCFAGINSIEIIGNIFQNKELLNERI